MKILHFPVYILNHWSDYDENSIQKTYTENSYLRFTFSEIALLYSYQSEKI